MVDEGLYTNICHHVIVIVFIDNEVPKITCVEDKETDTDEGKPTAMVTWDDLQVEDNSGEVTVTCDPPSGTDFDIGQATVTCTAIDGSGNKITCDFHVYVTGILTFDSYLACSNQENVVYSSHA